MYLNVNLTPPRSGGSEGCCSSTPKTPEILNSLMSLSTTKATSYNFHHQVSSGELLSPTSSSTSPSEEIPCSQFGTPPHNAHLSPTYSSDTGEGITRVLAKISGVFHGVPAFMSGSPSPPVPELPSPVSTFEATKSALIKEGLKHQIQTKLQAIGMDSADILADTIAVKEELSDSSELTPQDEERRLRRRERNKVAATKCRNKKKEKTVVLITESESVEGMNIRLKTEIQRLRSEKQNLQRILDDPKHIASCLHKCKKRPPTLKIPHKTTTSHSHKACSLSTRNKRLSSKESVVLPEISIQANSKSSKDEMSSLSTCSPTTNTTSCDFNFNNVNISPSFVNLCSSTTLSCTLPDTSLPQLVISNRQYNTQATNMPNYMLSPPSNSFSEESSIYGFPSSQTLQSPSSQIPLCSPSILPSSSSFVTGTSSQSLPSPLESSSPLYTSKSSRHNPPKRTTPYSVDRQNGVAPSQMEFMNSYSKPEDCLEFPYIPQCSENLLPFDISSNVSNKSSTNCSFESTTNPANSIPGHSSMQNNIGKMRPVLPVNQCRYSPYDRANRPYDSHSTQPVNSSVNENSFFEDQCNAPVSNAFLSNTDTHYYQQCTYENI